MSTTYAETVAPCPIENAAVPNTPENLFRFAVVEALRASADMRRSSRAFTALPKDATKDQITAGYAPVAADFARLGQWFTTALLMKQACADAPRDRADLAEHLVGIYEDGGLFDELLWEWARDLSIDDRRVVAEREQQHAKTPG